MSEPSHERIVKLLQEKILLKQEVYAKTKDVFDQLKKTLSQLSSELKSSLKKSNNEILVEFKETGEHELEFTLADETLVLVMHTNIFTFDNAHAIWKSKYVQQDTMRAYCGKIFIYNFLSDSFRYSRINDVGYLIARIFINKEGHFFVEGKKQLSYLYNDFPTTELNSENIQKIIESSILYSLDFDPFTPPFEHMAEISVKEVMEANLQSRIATGKRLGFQFEGQQGQIID